MANMEKLAQIANMLRSDPEVRSNFSFFRWGQRQGCGTTGCAIGWAAIRGIVSGPTWRADGVMMNDIGQWMKDLDLSNGEFQQLFTAGCQDERRGATADDLAKSVHDFMMEQHAKQQA